jgi:16S rRNA (adenine1518-N6/adenine1519-N6)-dimethyltransferase
VSSRPRPKLGQHFLSDSRYRRRILEALDLRQEDLVIEIGAGKGAMTELLAARVRRVIAIEIDPALAQALKEKMRHELRVEVVQADILAAELGEICRRNQTEKCFAFGNLPYYITSPILHRLFAFRTSIRAMALLVQKEVALRLTSSPGTRAYGYLSVLVQAYSEPRILFSVPPSAFSPSPKVHSALVEFRMAPRFSDWGLERQEGFLDFVKTCFAKKRKTLLNNLGMVCSREKTEQELARLNLPPTTRAEQLAVHQFAQLFERLR